MRPANVGDPEPSELIGVPNRSTRAAVLDAAGSWNAGWAAARWRAAVGDLGWRRIRHAWHDGVAPGEPIESDRKFI